MFIAISLSTNQIDNTNNSEKFIRVRLTNSLEKIPFKMFPDMGVVVVCNYSHTNFLRPIKI